MNPKCSECIFSKKIEEKFYECRFNPPTVLIEKSVYRDGTTTFELQTCFPNIEENDWCGSFKQKNDW